MKILVACEFSGVVRDAFIARGHEAVSCDLLPTERPGPHIQDDVMNHLYEGWDMMIFHWPCTVLTNSGVTWLYEGDEKDMVMGPSCFINQKRWQEMEVSAKNFRFLLDFEQIPKRVGENPIPHPYARAIMGDYTQLIWPYEHGHGELKRTALWLRGVPKLQPSNIVYGYEARTHNLPPSADRWKERSRTLPGIAKAMAEQWG